MKAAAQELVAQNVARFDTLAADWDDNPVRMGIARAVITAVSNELRLEPGMTALDFGCGTGIVALALAPLLRQVIGADTSAAMLAVLQDKARAVGADNVSTRLLTPGSDDAESLAGLAVDIVITSMALHHIPDTGAVVARLRDAMRPGGQLAIVDLDSEDGSFHGDVPGIAHFGFDRGRLAELVRAAGFVDVHTRTVHHVVRSTPGEDADRSYPLFLLTARRG